ncbi:MAG: hypothetical protein JJ913_00870 [Rhizobiaceae bacterium]|nr:hypothetical protein [Rhizobiaceae bacterium]
MARRRSSLGFLGIFGRSSDLRQLDAALHAADLHPATVPEPAKLTIVNLMKDYFDDDPPEESYPLVAAFFAYCLAGPDAFARANGPEALRLVEQRMEAALAEGDGPDAQLVLLSLHANLIHPDVVERFDIDVEDV